jgi:hypothetical protein
LVTNIYFAFYVTLLLLHGFPFDMLWQPAVGPDGRRVEAEGNVLLASIENMQYAVSVDVLHTVSKLGKYYSNMPHDLV